jgi:hypothetical protein
MSRNRQVGEEEAVATRQAVDPAERARDGRAIVHAKARLVPAADVAGVGQDVEAAIAYDGVHAKVAEAPGVEQRRVVGTPAEMRRDAAAWCCGVGIGIRVERGIP